MRFRKKTYEYSKKKTTKLTHLIMSLCVAVFLLEVFISFIYGIEATGNMFSFLGFSLQNLFSKPWILITSIFLHASPEHLILNMFALYFFGRVVEEELGWKKLILIFFISAFLGDLAIASSNLLGIYPTSIPTIGASAAIFGLMGTAMLIRPLGFIFYPYLIPVPLVLVAIVYILYNIGAFLVVLVLGGKSEIAYAAHLGGLIGGILFGLKEERSRRGLIIVIIFILLLLLPLVWNFLMFLEQTNYLTIFSQVLK